MAAIGIPKFETGPQKWVVKTYFKVSLLKILCESFCAAELVTGEDISVLLLLLVLLVSVLRLAISAVPPKCSSSPCHLFTCQSSPGSSEGFSS